MLKEIKKGFTLAEVLIVIGIIGVVAALTLPNLNHATGDKERISKVKKIYSVLSDAYDRAQVVYGDAINWKQYAKNSMSEEDWDNIGSSNLFTNRISQFTKNSSIRLDNNGIDKIIKLTDGIEYTVVDDWPTQWPYGTNQTYVGCIVVDLDGFDKGKNLEGYDQFIFDMTNQGLFPEGFNKDLLNCLFNAENCGDNLGHYGASRWIIENDNLDYLKADDTGKCNDSDIVLDWTNNTSCH